MLSDDLFFNLLAFAAGIYFFYTWWVDTKTRLNSPQTKQKGLLPGTELASVSTCILATIGAIGIVLAVTVSEIKLGVAEDQSTIAVWFLPAMLGAAVTEEMIFRGFLVIKGKGRFLLIASILLFSTLFAFIHPYLWTHAVESPKGLQWLTTLKINLQTQTMLATASIWLLSIWFYTVRFWSLNKKQSLLPCFCAHAGANLAVFIIKLCTGHVELP